MKGLHVFTVVAACLMALPLAAQAAQTRAPVRAAAGAPPVAPAVAYPYETAPWWANQSVVTQTGYVFTEVAANRANFSATFVSMDKTVAGAQGQAIDKTRGLQQVLGKMGRDSVRVTTGFSMRALYQQYRDRNGNMIEDRRGDKINGYEVSLTVSVEVRDLSQLEQAYALVLAASPTRTDDISFSLQPDNAMTTWLYTQAIKDARERASDAAMAAGVSLGAPRVIDPTGRACSSDILAARHGRVADSIVDSIQAEDIGSFPDKSVAESLQRVGGVEGGYFANAAPPPPPPPPPGSAEYLQAQALKNPFIQTPPLMRLESQACVVYELK